jgi:hypothetical protein
MRHFGHVAEEADRLGALHERIDGFAPETVLVNTIRFQNCSRVLWILPRISALSSFALAVLDLVMIRVAHHVRQELTHNVATVAGRPREPPIWS